MRYLKLLTLCAALAALSILLAHKPAKAQAPQPQPYLLARPACTPLRPWLYGRIWVTPPRYYAVPLAPVAPVCPHCQSR